jgi:aspartate/methionine/tyrosine aminotransferase
MSNHNLWESNSLFSGRVLSANLQLGKQELNKKAKELIEAGVNIIDLSGYLIERPRGTVPSPPQYVMDAVTQALRKELQETDIRGLATLREIIAEIEGKKTRLDIDPESEVMVTSGGVMQGMFNVLQALVEPGDEVLIFRPGLSYDDQIKLAGGIPVFVNLKQEQGYTFDSSKLESAITPKSKLLILNTPHNPTGHVASRTELEGIAEVVKRHNLIVLSD